MIANVNTFFHKINSNNKNYSLLDLYILQTIDKMQPEFKNITISVQTVGRSRLVSRTVELPKETLSNYSYGHNPSAVMNSINENTLLIKRVGRPCLPSFAIGNTIKWQNREALPSAKCADGQTPMNEGSALCHACWGVLQDLLPKECLQDLLVGPRFSKGC